MNKQIFDMLKADNAKWTDIINSIPIGIAIFSIENDVTTTIALNDRLIDFANKMGELLDGKERHWLRSDMMHIFDQNIYAFSAEKDMGKIEKMLKDSCVFPFSNCTFQLKGSSDAHPIWLHSECFSKEVSKTSRKYYVTFSDVTADINNRLALEKNHELLSYMNRHDPLTGVKNRNAYNSLIEELKAHRVTRIGIAFADVNGLKEVNDSIGHKNGDVLICKFSNILCNEFGQEDVYRISGDEFVLILQDISSEEFREKMSRVTGQIKSADHVASIGFLWESSLDDIEHGISRAEQLMYVEKQRFYADQETTASRHRPELLTHLLRDIELGNYRMYLQPKANINESSIIGAEALVRRFDENEQMILPVKFIPQLERERLIPVIDYFILEEACKVLQRWEKEGRAPICISTNMSRVTLAENDFHHHVRELLEKYQINPAYLELEITESSETLSNDKLISEMSALKELGLCVSLDDMGTDYSALHMLLLDGLDIVKLDRSFILSMGSKKGDILLRNIIHTCHALGLSCVAEGVETDAQRLQLLEMGCDMYQGYLLSRPVPVEEFERLLG